jgi:hypothetical protein
MAGKGASMSVCQIFQIVLNVKHLYTCSGGIEDKFWCNVGVCLKNCVVQCKRLH